MQITKKQIKLKDIAKGYQDLGDDGVFGYGGQLNIRPPYQREFVYKDKQRDAVIDTINKGYPLNTIYWAKNDDGSYEIIDGQQRTISFAKYINNDFSINKRSWINLTADEKNRVLNYELDVYICEGTEAEKLDWFRTINIAGEKLTDQELLNATYTGAWLEDVKSYFSKPNSPAFHLSKDYLKGSAIRQDYLETVLSWISKDGKPETYMAEHQRDFDAVELWDYFHTVIDWVMDTFLVYRSPMKGIAWGELYNKFATYKYPTPLELEEEIKRLMMDDEVTKKSGIYEYVLSGDEKLLSIRAFTESIKRSVYETQGGICAHCGTAKDYVDMQADHVSAWSRGGKSTIDNCEMLCATCNNKKGAK